MQETYNETDLHQACLEAGFPSAHRGLGPDFLFQILEGRRECPKGPDCLLERHRRGMKKLADRYAGHIRNQLGCDADCAKCPDPMCAECAVSNSDLTQTR